MDATLFESTDEGETLDPASYPGAGNAFVLALTALAGAGGDVFAGTHTGSVLRRVDGEWTGVGNVPARIRSLATI